MKNTSKHPGPEAWRMADEGMEQDESVQSEADTRRNSNSCSFEVHAELSTVSSQRSQHPPAQRSMALAALLQRSRFVPPPTLSGLRMGMGISVPQTRPWRVGAIYPVVAGRLSFVVHSDEQQTQEQIDAFPRKYFFSADFQERYEPFCLDFGPVNLGVIHAFCLFMRKYWNCTALQNREMVYYSEVSPAKRTNCAFLLAAFLVVELGYSADQAWAPFQVITGKDSDGREPFLMFRDATFSEQDYGLTIHACLQGLAKAMQLQWYNPNTFSAGDYDYLDNPCNADMHVVSPKFVAFKGPSESYTQVGENSFTFPPGHYAEVFLDKKVTAVVRLNEADTYKADVFVEAGLHHFDLYFDDCTVPSNALVLRFLDICEREQGMVAVHCRAGLGRTGTLIAAYFIKHFEFTASECIGWLRIVRPGSVIGPQQHYLHWLERTLKGTPASTGAYQPWQLAPRLQLSSEDSAAMGQRIAEAQAARARARVFHGVASVTAQTARDLEQRARQSYDAQRQASMAQHQEAIHTDMDMS